MDNHTNNTILISLMVAALIVSIAQAFILLRLDTTARNTNVAVLAGVEVSKDNNRIIKGREVVIIQPGARDNVRRGEVAPRTDGKPEVKPQNYIAPF